uniref:Uncharacterized protein n=1 Tax=Quercus lobata TaxID=97700 RepID=A0A7N2M9F3_QUELO
MGWLGGDVIIVAVERASGVVEKTGGGGYIDRMRGVTEVLKWLAINFRDSVTHLFSRWLAFRQAHLVMCIIINDLLRIDIKFNHEDKARMLMTSLPAASYEYLVTTFLWGKETLEN